MSVNWEKVQLGDVCDFQNGFAFKSNTFCESGIPLLRISNIQNESINTDKLVFINPSDYKEDLSKYKIFKNDLLIAMSGATTGKIGINHTDFEYLLNQRVGKFSPGKDLEKRFLYYFLFAKVDHNLAISVGSAQPNLSTQQIKEFQIPFPPLSEQKRIVAILDEAFEGIDRAIANTEKNLTNARELFESYLNCRLLDVVSGKATQTLLCITDLIIDCEHKTAPVQEEGIPSIRTPNIGKGYLIFDDVYRISEETYELWTRRGKPEPGDLILAREAPAGNVGVIPPGAKVCLGQRTVLIRPNENIIDSYYLAFLLLHPIVQKRLLDKSTGATVQHVNMKDIRGLSMSELPSIQVQKKCLESIYQQKLTSLDELKQSILQKAFAGELTADTANQTIEAAEENRGISKDCLPSAETVKQNVYQSGQLSLWS
jgi:type I restriction enzyme, S subunit